MFSVVLSLLNFLHSWTFPLVKGLCFLVVWLAIIDKGQTFLVPGQFYMSFIHLILANIGPTLALGPLVQVSALWAPTYGL